MRKEDITETSKSSQENGGCFIATEVYGSYTTPEVVRLRKFRDDVLEKNIIGRLFISLYYVLSPYLAKKISQHDNIKKMIKNIVIDKLVSKLS